MDVHHRGDVAGRPPSRCRRQLRAFRFLIGAGVLLAVFPRAASPQEAKFDEYQVKAAFIHNFVKFVEWPNAVPRGGAVPKAFCILGADPFGRNAHVVLGGSSQRTEPLATRIGSLEEARDCRILFVTSSEKDRFADVVAAVAESPVLTIADSEGGARQGVMINFYLEEEMVRFEINVEAMRRAGLKASAKLLKLARIVN
jgi:hypothetical protein